jgi:hypothetical protein
MTNLRVRLNPVAGTETRIVAGRQSWFAIGPTEAAAAILWMSLQDLWMSLQDKKASNTRTSERGKLDHGLAQATSFHFNSPTPRSNWQALPSVSVTKVTDRGKTRTNIAQS